MYCERNIPQRTEEEGEGKPPHLLPCQGHFFPSARASSREVQGNQNLPKEGSEGQSQEERGARAPFAYPPTYLQA